jgi:subtilisin family serine protease
VRTLVALGVLALALLGGGALAAPPVEAPASQRPRIVVGFANEPYTAPAPAGTTGSRYSGGGYHVTQSAHQQAQRVAAAYALHEVVSWPIRALSMHCVVYEITDGRPVPEVLAALSKDARVVLAQPLQEFHTLSNAHPAAPYNDPLYDLQTNLLTLGIAHAHERARGAGVRIALIDTGVDTHHPDLQGRIVRTHSFVPGSAPAAPLLRHGTAMAGLIAAVANNHVGIVGIAPEAELEVFEACWQLRPDADAAACNTFTMAQALAGALASGAPLVNLSVAGPADPLLTALLESGLKRGIIFVGAAGGDGEAFPGAVPGVIVAAGSERAAPAGAFTAPAQHVLTLRPGAEYDFESGTSVAAAEVTGVIALLMSASGTHLTAHALVRLLAPAGGALPAAAGPSPVDAGAALARLDAGLHRSAVAARAGR